MKSSVTGWVAPGASVPLLGVSSSQGTVEKPQKPVSPDGTTRTSAVVWLTA